MDIANKDRWTPGKVVMFMIACVLLAYLVVSKFVVDRLNFVLARYDRKIVEPGFKHHGNSGYHIVRISAPPLTPEQVAEKAENDAATAERLARFRELLRKV